MRHIWRILLLISTFLLNTIYAVDDLLDQYVKHIENVNKIPENIYNYNTRITNNNKYPKLNQRFKKSVTFKDDSLIINSNDFTESNRISRKLLSALSSHDNRENRYQVNDLNQWTHAEVLDDQGRVVLRWQLRHQEILFRVEAKTKGYVGIGFSPDGAMEGADIVLGWVDDSSLKTHLLDCHGVPKSQGSAPIRDEIDNYTVMRGFQNDTHTVIEFRRVLDTCDIHDYVLNSDTVRVIWALHELDPRYGDEMIYHGENRGVQSLHLMGPPPVPKLTGAHVRNWDVTLKNFVVRNNMDTIYWCKIFKAPTLNQKNHIIGFEPLIGKNHTEFVHHMILHECELDSTSDIHQWNQFANENDHGRLCYGNDMPPEWAKCLTPLVAWAVGSKGENFPRNVGLPLENKKSSFYMLEVHFDNPSMKKAKDTSGLRLHYTHQLREHEGGIFVTGVALSTLHFIPPNQKEYKTAGYCSFGCTKQVFPKDGINVVSVMLHSHLAGRRLRLRHIRGGKELPTIAQDDHYDFNYQQSRSLTQNTIILPGDGLVTECAYSTIKRKKPTLGGYSTKDEMCLAFVLHYPRTELAGCYSMPPIKYFFENLGVKEFYGHKMSEVENMILQGENEIPVSATTPTGPLFPYNPGDEMSPEANRRAIIALQNAKEYTIEGESSDGLNVFDKLIIKQPVEFQNKSFTTHLQDIPYNEPLLTKKMEEYFYTGLHFTFCRKRDDSPAIKETIERFPNFTAYENKERQILCSYKLKRSSSGSTTLKPNISLSFIVLIPLFILYINNHPIKQKI